MVLSIVLPLVSALSGAISQVISKRLVGGLGARLLTTLSFITIFAMMTPFAPLFFQLEITGLASVVLVSIALNDTFANYLYFSALDLDEVSTVSAVSATSPLFTALISAVVLPEQTGPVIFGITTIVVLGIYLVETDENILAVWTDLRAYETLIVVSSAILFGISAILMRFAMTEWQIVNAPTLYWVRSALIAVMMIGIFRPQLSTVTKGDVVRVGGRSVFVIIAWVLYLYVIGTYNLVTSMALAKTTPLFVMLIAWHQMDDTITVTKIIGVGLILIGIVLVTVT